jgi:polyisoprenoid-binding protein YceI
MKSSFKRIQMTILVVCLLLTSLSAFKAYSQDKHASSGNAKITVKGTSNIHDWVLNSDGGFFNITFSDNMSGISGLVFKLPVETLKSESKAMDKNTYKALNASRYTTISFDAADITAKQLSANTFILTSRGKLTISGVTKTVLLSAKAVVNNNDNSITYYGAYTLKMTDYNVEPPTAMFGAIKTGDSITINYSVRVKGENYLSQLSKN